MLFYFLLFMIIVNYEIIVQVRSVNPFINFFLDRTPWEKIEAISNSVDKTYYAFLCLLYQKMKCACVCVFFFL